MPDDVVLNGFSAEITEKNESSVLFKVENTGMPQLIAQVASSLNPLDINIESVPLEEIIEDIYRK
jgi:ABC-type uncharacterized transport system ATPase subunit